MATGHQMSVLTNSCVKTPLTVRKTIENEKQQPSYDTDIENIDPAMKSDMKGVPVSDFRDGLDELSDAEFYKRLVELRNEHRKTLQLCERLYNEKLGYLPHTLSPKSSMNNHQPVPTQTLFGQDTFVDSYNAQDNFVMQGNNMNTDKIRDMSVTQKPPSGKTKKIGSKNLIALSDDDGSDDLAHLMDTVNVDFWQNDSIRSSNSDLRTSKPIERCYSAIHNDTKAMAMSKIEDMFSDFTVDEYAPRIRKRSNSVSAISEEKSEVKEWRHRITIPQPFDMTLREQKQPKKKAALMLEIEKKREEKLKQEEAECQKRFKARPVPANIYLPLFDEIMEKKEARRRETVEQRTLLLQSIQKPFKFSIRDDKMKAVRKSCLDYDDSAKKEFKAQPFPEHIFDSQVNDKILEEEEYRRIRMQMRSEDLLRSASLPPTMEARGKDYIQAKSRQKARLEKYQTSTTDFDFRPKISRDVPDFSEIHRKFYTEVEGKRQPKEATTCQPFSLRTAERTQHHKSFDADTSTREDNNKKEDRWPYKSVEQRSSQLLSKSLGSMSSSFDTTIPAKMTTSVEIRSKANREKAQRELAAKRMRDEEEKVRKLKEQKMRKIVLEKAAASDRSSLERKNSDFKTQELRKQTVYQSRDYKKSLNDMNSKLADRPFLFEQVAQANAKKRMEKKYKDTLKECGLSEEYVEKLGVSALEPESQQEEGRNTFTEWERSDQFDDLGLTNGQAPSNGRNSQSSQNRRYSDDFESGSNGSRTDGRGKAEVISDVEEDLGNRGGSSDVDYDE